MEVAVTGTVTSVGLVGFGVGLWVGVGVGLGVVVVVVDGNGGYAERNISVNWASSRENLSSVFPTK